MRPRAAPTKRCHCPVRGAHPRLLCGHRLQRLLDAEVAFLRGQEAIGWKLFSGSRIGECGGGRVLGMIDNDERRNGVFDDL